MTREVKPRAEKRQRLFEIAATQGGYFTAAQARAVGYSPRALVYHGTTGDFERISRGFYRLREFHAVSQEDVIAAWLKVGPDKAVVSHETALALYELSTVRPRKIDLTVLREKRPPGNRPLPSAVRIHTTTQPLEPREVVQRFGVRVTSPARTIVDAAAEGTEPDYIHDAVSRALARGLLTEKELNAAVAERSARVRRLIRRAAMEAQHGKAVR